MRPPFLFLKVLYEVKQVVSSLVLIYFGRCGLEHTIKANFITFQPVDLEICSILIFYKRVWDYNPGHNIFELYKTLVKIRFATSKSKLDM